MLRYMPEHDVCCIVKRERHKHTRTQNIVCIECSTFNSIGCCGKSEKKTEKNERVGPLIVSHLQCLHSRTVPVRSCTRFQSQNTHVHTFSFRACAAASEKFHLLSVHRRCILRNKDNFFSIVCAHKY